MAKLTRPGPYVPLSVTFHTGRTGTAILDEFGLEGLGVWVAMLAAAKDTLPEGWIVFRHEEDWGAIGLAASPASFPLKSFLTFLGRRKQTRTTSQGRIMYVELTQWGRWHKLKETEDARLRMSRKRGTSKRNADRTPTVTPVEHERASRAREEPEQEQEQEKPPDPPLEGGQRISRRKPRYTGCRETRGSHGNGYVRDPLGTDKPPADWPHPAPSAEEVRVAIGATNGKALVQEDPQRFVELTGWELEPDELEQILELHVPDSDERIRLVDLAADLRREAEVTA